MTGAAGPCTDTACARAPRGHAVRSRCGRGSTRLPDLPLPRLLPKLLLLAALVALLPGCQRMHTDRVVEIRSATQVERDALGIERIRQVDLPQYLHSESGAALVRIYRVRFRTRDDDDRYAALIPRLGDRAAFRLNGRVIGGVDLPPTHGPEFGIRPILLYLPAPMLTGVNELEIELTAEGSRTLGLSRLHIGPVGKVEPLFHLAWSLSYGAVVVLLSAGVLMLLFATLLWRGTRDRLFLHFGAASLSLVLYAGSLLWWFDDAIGPVTTSVLRLTYHSFIAFIARYTLGILDLTSAGFRHAIVAYWSIMAAAIVATAVTDFAALYPVASLGGLVLLGLGLTRALGIALSRATTTTWSVVFVAILAVAAGIRDNVALLLPEWQFGTLPLGRLTMIGFMIVLIVYMIERYSQSLADLRALNATLECRVAAAQAELAEAFDSLRAAERNAAIAQERHRLTRDIHDGLGSQLLATLSIAREAGRVSPQAVVDSIEACMTELRLAIDAMEPYDDDLPSALGTLRSRVEPMLARRGIRLVWRVRAVTGLPPLDAEAVSHVFRILMEAITNTVKHAQANRIVLSCASSRRRTWFSLRDNGVGFMPDEGNSEGTGRGRTTMRERAKAIGARLQHRSGPNGTLVRIIWNAEPSPTALTPFKLSRAD